MSAVPPFAECVTASPEETVALGRRVGGAVAAGDVIGLIGPLGAGKTQLVRGIALGAGVPDGRLVSSPTFVLHNHYLGGRIEVHHLDAYRLRSPGELAAIGFEELLESGGAVLVEWADRVRSLLPERTIWIEIAPEGESVRRLRATGPRDALERMVCHCFKHCELK